jgi:DNA-binding NarL/FixJ family response regulator
MPASVTARLRFVQGLARGAWDPAIAQARDDPVGISLLTTRELEIVRGVVSGDRVRAIANGLFLSESTVRSHLSSIYRKLAVRSHQELLDRLRAADLD